VTFRGSVTPTTNWGAVGVATTIVLAGGLAAEFRPGTATAFLCGGNVMGTVFRVVLATDGSIAVQCSTATSTTAVWLTNVTFEL
jgi:hypothetical protein